MVMDWDVLFWFVGKITRDPNNSLAARLEGTDFAGSFYWANNFNDMLSAKRLLLFTRDK